MRPRLGKTPVQVNRSQPRGHPAAARRNNSTGTGFLPLANFATESYGQDYTSIAGTNYAAVNGVREPINYFLSDSPSTWWKYTMVNESYAIHDNGINPQPYPPPSADIMAAPSALSTYTSSSFTVTWKSAGP